MNPKTRPTLAEIRLAYGRPPRVDLGVAMNAINVHAAIIASNVLPALRCVYDWEIAAAVHIENAIRALENQLARSTYELVNAIVINRLTQRILPSVSKLDSKIEKACTMFSWVLGGSLITLTHGIFWIIALCSALILTYMPILGSCLMNLFSENQQQCEKTSAFLGTAQKNTLLRTKNTAPVTFPAILIDSAKNSAYAVLYVACMYLLAPIYVICSTFGLDSKFNIYTSNRSHGNGVVQNYILDMREIRRHTEPAHLPPVTVHDGELFGEAHGGHPSMIIDARLISENSNRRPLSLLTDPSISLAKYKIEDWEQFFALRT